MNIVVLISGTELNLQAIIDACEAKKIKGTLRAVFSTRPTLLGLERAREAGIPAQALTADRFDTATPSTRVDSQDRRVCARCGRWPVLCVFWSPMFTSLLRAFKEHSPFPAAKISAACPAAKVLETARSTGTRHFRQTNSTAARSFSVRRCRFCRRQRR